MNTLLKVISGWHDTLISKKPLCKLGIKKLKKKNSSGFVKRLIQLIWKVLLKRYKPNSIEIKILSIYIWFSKAIEINTNVIIKVIQHFI